MRSRGPRRGQHFGTLDCNLIDQGVFAQTREALDNMFLIAMELADEVVPFTLRTFAIKKAGIPDKAGAFNRLAQS